MNDRKEEEKLEVKMNPRMKKSDLKSYIRENIIEILSEEEGTITTKDSTEAEKLAKKGINVNLTKEEVSLNIQQKKKKPNAS